MIKYAMKILEKNEDVLIELIRFMNRRIIYRNKNNDMLLA